MSNAKVPTLKLNSGQTIPQLGLGLWKMYLGKTCREAVQAALDIGYRHFDTAQVYLNEQHLGRALSESDVDRKNVFITTKIRRGNFGESDLLPSFEKSLKKLRTDYVDLLLLHFPVTGERQAAWKRMEELHKSGQARAIGVSNYTVKHLEELLASCKVKPAVNQVELHVFLQQTELITYCKQHDIVIEAYSPLAHGQGMDDPVLAGLAKKHGKTPAQIMLRWLVEQGLVVIPKSSHRDRLQQNFDIFDFKLDATDLKKIAGLDRNLRTCWDPSDVE